MKYLALTVTLFILLSGLTVVHTQPSQTKHKTPSLAADVERIGNQIFLVITNLSETQAFQGSATVNSASSNDVAIRLSLTLAPRETSRIALFGLMLTNNQYSLTVYTQAGAIVMSRIAPIKLTGENKTETAPKQIAAPDKSEKVKVTMRLTRGLANSEAELPTPNAVEPFLLTFDIESLIPINDGNFTLSSKNFQRRQAVTTQDRASLEFKLPDSLSERRLIYTVSAGNAQTLVHGEVDLDQLTASDAVSVSELTFDSAVYAPGEQARVVMELRGNVSNRFRLEVMVKDGSGTPLFKDSRKGVINAGLSRQEFLLDLSREVKGPITLAYQVFGSKTGTLFDSGLREIVLNEASATKAGEGKRISP